MEQLTFSLGLVNGILQYLSTRPYGEVFQLISGLNQEAEGQLQTGVKQEEPKAE